ncbi:MAG: pyrimidine 5'-nucleotidase [Candidatus Dactylopiibacterium carminicum]|uniref:Pyrimidine 5'-nucleotidase n=1 Tax=Candidatus Dactylopiibacterium carminicum TaxID=857335 RepID=A0A272ETE7_9RHOO|nr:pyrimidine 5'-nucleotidase [Candidatus Dactylopiibacterium carminicum]KAF7599348.1 pyrimidine 5'-nucleotidase [Candidatus Dactylopiibacterium carminicum]PAS93358.1 MAG: pyrimidine 5'-nucleotidase [Candidatus Dactylopiibacterium carminicum]PAS98312.1 MAG: pyrimidine 5'-nucleotidase [Candidatus Dactylopiibacterium carminicum]PAS99354.1 MAG: pyrimidine 5'-nucleotidase [Candidatus Dactylopiibacterium carminicum]
MKSAAPVWLFDLDNTLHNASAHIFPHINRAMTEYLARRLDLSLEEAGALRMHYWRRYGATLNGMVRKHNERPSTFLAATHQFDDLAGMVVFDHALLTHLRHLPGRKYIFSNAPRSYLDEVLRVTGLDRVMDGSFAVEDLGYFAKPQLRGFRAVLRRVKVPARRCIMVEDTAMNLRPAHRLGMRTVWISSTLRKPAWVDRRLRSALQLRAW